MSLSQEKPTEISQAEKEQKTPEKKTTKTETGAEILERKKEILREEFNDANKQLDEMEALLEELGDDGGDPQERAELEKEIEMIEQTMDSIEQELAELNEEFKKPEIFTSTELEVMFNGELKKNKNDRINSSLYSGITNDQAEARAIKNFQRQLYNDKDNKGRSPIAFLDETGIEYLEKLLEKIKRNKVAGAGKTINEAEYALGGKGNYSQWESLKIPLILQKK